MNDDFLIESAFSEDIPDGDITTGALEVPERFGIAHLIAKQDLTLSGTSLFEKSLAHIDPELEVQWHFNDADPVLDRQTVADIRGNLISLIQAERVALNFLGFLSGIATQTRRFVDACEGTETRILDTRKTLPLYREHSKKAVRHGGGTNHRMHLSDGVLIKENHVAIAGGFRQCLLQVKVKTDQPIEVETQTLKEVEEAVEIGVHRIMLDNMSNDEMKACLEKIPPHIESEASGNMTIDRISGVAALGVDFISVGALTHSVKNADFSLIFDWS